MAANLRSMCGSALCYNGRNGPCDLRVLANSLSSWSRASSVSHSPRTMPHLGQSIRNASSPLSCAPNVKFGGVLQVEQTKISVPFRAFIPERCISIMVSDLTLGRSREWPFTSAGGLCFRPAQMSTCRIVGCRTVIAGEGAAPVQLAILTRDANEIRALHVKLALHASLTAARRKRGRSPKSKYFDG
jgi:hypothetical protein